MLRTELGHLQEQNVLLTTEASIYSSKESFNGDTLKRENVLKEI